MFVPDLEKLAYNLLGVTAPVVIYLWSNKRKAKRDQDRRHEENQKILQQVVAERQFLPAHRHSEKDGPLYADGIWPLPTAPKPDGH
jgi:hypothetical protein